MKRHLLASFLVLFVGATSAGRAAIVYSGVQNITIPFNPDGVYLNVQSGATASSEPGTWATGPWINPFFAGTVIASSDHLLPVITGADRIVNLGSGTLIGSGSTFAAGESGSSTHVGVSAEQFQPGSPGYIGFKWQPPGGGADYYGWMQIVVDDTGGPGSIQGWAYENTSGTSIGAGVTAVPEPTDAFVILLMALPFVCLLTRSRRSVAAR